MKNTLHFAFVRTLMILVFGIFSNGAWAQTEYTWNCNSASVATTGSNPNITYGTWTQGNNNGTTTLINNSAASSGYSGSSGTNNFGLAARTGTLNVGANGSAFLEISFTPQAGYSLSITSISFGSRSSGTGPALASIRTNLDNFASTAGSNVLSTAGVWQLISPTLSSAISTVGNTAITIRIYGSNGTGSAGVNTANWRIDDIKITVAETLIPATTTWNGTAWSNGTPSATLDAIIAGNYNTLANGAFASKSLTVNSGIFTIASGTAVTVEGAIANNAGADNFIVQSGANLIQTNNAANTGSISVRRNSAPIVRLDHTLWSSPVDAQNLFAFSPNTLASRFYTYSTAANTYVNAGLTAGSTFMPGKGYGVRAPNNYQASPAASWTGTFKGIPNNGAVSLVLSTASTGYNLVGNPYPSAISATAFVNDANNSTKIDGTLYFYAHSLAMDAGGSFPAGTNYATWNSLGTTSATNSSVVPNGTIQVGQGFIVKAVQAGNVNFSNAMRSSNTSDQFFRTANAYTSDAEKHRIWLNLSDGSGFVFSQALIGYAAGATAGFDRGYDGLSFGNTGSSLTSIMDGSEYAIQGRPLPLDVSDAVQLSFKAAAAGNYAISLAGSDGI
ncbi:MAG TPA: hypothetical protein VFR70_11055, partial [Flavobacterium sp.]|nr:hypothetical protein [Flavobacterium sp.]